MDKYRKLFKNKYVLIMAAAGLILMLFSLNSDSGTSKADTTVLSETGFSVEELEEKIADALSEISGAGKVRVVLTVKSSTEQVVAENSESTETSDDNGTESENSVQTVVIDAGNSEAPVTLKYIYPEFQGALIIAEGADNAAVRLAITDAVASLTGIGTDRITVTN